MADFVRLDKYAAEKQVSEIMLRRKISNGEIHGYKMPGSRLIFLDREEMDAAMRPIPAVKPVRR